MTSSQYVVVVGDFFFLQNRNRETFFCEGGDWIFAFFSKRTFFTKVHPPSPWQGLQ